MALRTLQGMAADVGAFGGSALMATGFADYIGFIEVGLGLAAAGLGLVAVVYSILYNRERYKKLKEERLNGRDKSGD